MAHDEPAFQLRPATRNDLGFAWHLYRDLMKPLAAGLLEWREDRQQSVVERDLLSGEASTIVAGGQRAGWLHVRQSAEALELCQLYIVPSLQGRGIGAAIVQQLIGEARQNGMALTLEVMKNNRARALYERLGFVQTGEGQYKVELTWRDDDEVPGVE